MENLISDARTLLANEDARDAIYRLVQGKPAANGFLASSYGTRKAIAEAKKILAARSARWRDRLQADAARNQTPGNYSHRADQRRAAKVVAALKEAGVAWRTTEREQTTVVRFGEPDVRTEKRTGAVCYGRQGYRSAIVAGEFALTVPRTWLATVEARGLAVADGLATLSAEPVPSGREGVELYQATWVEQGRGFDLNPQAGWIARDVATGTTYHGTKSAKATVAGLRRKISAQAVPTEVRDERARARAERRQQESARLLARLSRRDLGELDRVEITREDSIRAGNCEPGTDDFARRLFGDCVPRKTTLGELASRLGSDPARYFETNRTLARQIVAAVLSAVRRSNREARQGRQAVAL